MSWPGEWDCAQTGRWLAKSGFERYASLLTREHRIDGKALLLLTEADLRHPPLSIPCLGDIKRLHLKICMLREQHSAHVRASDIGLLAAAPPPSVAGHGQSAQSSVLRSYSHLHLQQLYAAGPGAPSLPVPTGPWRDSYNNGGSSVGDAENLNGNVEARFDETFDWQEQNVYFLGLSKNLWITIFAAIYFQISLLITSFVMTVVHDRVPDMKTYPPLPDLFLDNVPVIPWAFQLCEVIACAMTLMWVTILFFHKHRVILLRRMFSLTGTVFLLRCVTMLITSLSVPGIHLECSSRDYGDAWTRMRQAITIWSGMGLSIRGVRSCGDYMFSGHSVAITLLNHFITEYIPGSWTQIITASWVMNLFGLFFILAAHEHYSIDVFVAFYISSRLFLYYHSMAYNVVHLRRCDQAMRSTRTWFPLFWLFELQGSIGQVSNEYEWPLPSLFEIAERVRRFVVTEPSDITAGCDDGGGTPSSHDSSRSDRRRRKRLKAK